MARWLPLVIVLAVMVIIAALVAPAIYRGMLFKRDCRALITAAQAGDKAGLTAACEPGQQAFAAALFNGALPPDFQNYIASLKLSTWERLPDGRVQSILTLRTEYNGSMGVYQGRLYWVWDRSARRWYWDIGSSEAAEFPLSGEPEWRSLNEMLNMARSYR